MRPMRARQIEEFLSVSGCDEMILSVLPTGPDHLAAIRNTLLPETPVALARASAIAHNLPKD